MHRLYYMAMLVVLFSSCTQDRDLENLATGGESAVDTTYTLVDYWDFNDNSAAGTLVAPVIGNGSLSYAGSYYDDVDDGSKLNIRADDETGLALRLRNPAGDFSIVLPTTGYKDVVVSYATKRTSSGPQQQSVYYSLDGTTYIQDNLENNDYSVSEEYVLHELDFSKIVGADDNADFKVKIVFATNADGDSGNSRFDNLTMDGIALNDSGDQSGDAGSDSTNELTLFDYWNFNDATDSATLIFPTIGNGHLDYYGSYYDDVDGSTVNAREDNAAGTGLRLRNPTGSFVMNLPTTGYKNIVVGFAGTRSGSGSATETISYTLDGTNYIQDNLDTTTYSIPEDYRLFQLDFSGIEGANNNASFKVKIDFDDNSAATDKGNSRFDNLTVEGNKL